MPRSTRAILAEMLETVDACRTLGGTGVGHPAASYFADGKATLASVSFPIKLLDELRESMQPPTVPPGEEKSPTLRGALQWLLDDMQDAGDDRNPESGVEYDSCEYARRALAQIDPLEEAVKAAFACIDAASLTSEPKRVGKQEFQSIVLTAEEFDELKRSLEHIPYTIGG
jgi:hypothetical protein